ncbi:uncharacterized protein BO95DRAFT_111893 [Aspergillus brunneoviolaceus CBS 621.78]|uniref:Uncharacterized protein n=1 Tax=Aspergillus brunneoviolaceus CBS 621.78 TaxID=1450534 RepID=A0ACD1GBA9_9EURO|nr:hypothetical protein BO95DRAFT_111893 [Aspergillus brunneoviolaceus CBS 621.78]RAH46414.1 hypothetical protein BO95DRAFT_111893 [Aspergillus brunneoviolaceus CBS 621.78]
MATPRLTGADCPDCAIAISPLLQSADSFSLFLLALHWCSRESNNGWMGDGRRRGEGGESRQLLIRSTRSDRAELKWRMQSMYSPVLHCPDDCMVCKLADCEKCHPQLQGCNTFLPHRTELSTPST